MSEEPHRRGDLVTVRIALNPPVEALLLADAVGKSVAVSPLGSSAPLTVSTRAVSRLEPAPGASIPPGLQAGARVHVLPVESEGSVSAGSVVDVRQGLGSGTVSLRFRVRLDAGGGEEWLGHERLRPAKRRRPASSTPEGAGRSEGTPVCAAPASAQRSTPDAAAQASTQAGEEQEAAAPSAAGAEGVPHSGRRKRALPGLWTVESIVGSRVRGGVTEYRVRWSGYDPSEDTYEPREHLSSQLVAEFEGGAHAHDADVLAPGGHWPAAAQAALSPEREAEAWLPGGEARAAAAKPADAPWTGLSALVLGSSGCCALCARELGTAGCPAAPALRSTGDGGCVVCEPCAAALLRSLTPAHALLHALARLGLELAGGGGDGAGAAAVRAEGAQAGAPSARPAGMCAVVRAAETRVGAEVGEALGRLVRAVEKRAAAEQQKAAARVRDAERRRAAAALAASAAAAAARAAAARAEASRAAAAQLWLWPVGWQQGCAPHGMQPALLQPQAGSAHPAAVAAAGHPAYAAAALGGLGHAFGAHPLVAHAPEAWQQPQQMPQQTPQQTPQQALFLPAQPQSQPRQPEQQQQPHGPQVQQQPRQRWRQQPPQSQ